MGVIDINRYIRFLYLLPIAMMIAFSFFFTGLTQEIQNSLLNEKFAEKKLEVAIMANHVDEFIKQDNDWTDEHEYYQQSLIYDMNAMDTADMTYAMVFDEQLSPLTNQPNYSGGFDPMVYQSFVSAIHQNQLGDMIIHFVPDSGTPRDIYVHYQWIPTGVQYSDRFLVVVAISQLSVVTKVSNSYTVGWISLIAITTILDIVMISIMIRKLNGRKG